jgi:hypothetical protein
VGVTGPQEGVPLLLQTVIIEGIGSNRAGKRDQAWLAKPGQFRVLLGKQSYMSTPYSNCCVE